ncbi:MAG: tetratricopeptide repeat protein [Candidatus Hodarchaeales archaeon]
MNYEYYGGRFISRSLNKDSEKDFKSNLGALKHYSGKIPFKESLRQIKELERLENSNLSNLLEINEFKGSILIKMGNYKEALSLTQEFIQISRQQKKPLQTINFIILRSEALWRLGRYDDSVIQIEQGRKLLKNIGEEPPSTLQEKAAHLNFHQGINQILTGDGEGAEKSISESLFVFEELEKQENITEALNILGLINLAIGKLEMALSLFRRSHTLSTKIENKRNAAMSLGNIGLIHQLQGNLDKALEYSQDSSQIFKEIGEKKNYAEILNQLGSVYRQKGQLNTAIKYIKKARHILEDIGAQRELGECSIHLGDIYRNYGELDQAKEHYNSGYALFQKINLKGILGAYALANLGRISDVRGERKKAEEYYTESIRMTEASGFEYFAAGPLYYLIKLKFEMDFEKEANYYLDKLEQIDENTKNMTVNQFTRLAQALQLKAINRVVEKGKAQEIFQEVAEEPVSLFEVTIEAILNLCNMLLEEVRTLGNTHILGEINNWIEKLLGVADSQKAFLLMTEAYLLQSKIALMELELEKGIRLLTRAETIAKEKGLKQLEREIFQEKMSLKDPVSSWQSYINSEKKPALKELFRLSKLDELIERMVSERLYRSENQVLQYVQDASQMASLFETDD